jgi:hypothetical protein
MRCDVRWFALLAFAVLPSVTAGACTFGKSEAKATSEPSATTATSAAPRNTFVRTCKTSVFGTLDSSGWEQHSITGGKLVFYYVDQYEKQPASLFAPIPGRKGFYAGQKLLILVPRDEVATVVVPESERRHARLLYDPAVWNDRNAYRVEDGETAVRFEGCKKGETVVGAPLNAMTQFNGSFVVAGARCLPLEVLVRGLDGQIPVTLSFGAGRCT